MKVLMIILLIFLLITGYLGYFIYQNLPGGSQTFEIHQNFPPEKLENISDVILQFFPNMRFNHNDLTYNFENCSKDKENKMKQAFLELEEKTKILTFSQSNKSDIQIGCSKDYLQTEKNVFVAGEGGPSEIYNSVLYPLIIRGKILLYDSSCDNPIVEMHELLHVFGLDHINKSDYIMYPYVNCSFYLNQEYVDYLVKLYSITPLPDLYFDYVNATKQGIYLNLEASIGNQGLSSIEDATLKIFFENKLVKEFSTEAIPVGSQKIITIKNLKLPSRNLKEIQLEIVSGSKEYTLQDNFANATLPQ